MMMMGRKGKGAAAPSSSGAGSGVGDGLTGMAGTRKVLKGRGRGARPAAPAIDTSLA